MMFSSRLEKKSNELSEAMAEVVKARLSGACSVVPKSGAIEISATVYGHDVDDIQGELQRLTGEKVRLIRQKEKVFKHTLDGIGGYWAPGDLEKLNELIMPKAPTYEVTFSVPVSDGLIKKFAETIRALPQSSPHKQILEAALDGARIIDLSPRAVR